MSTPAGPSPTDPSRKPSAAESATGTAAETARRRVLVVDDNIDAAESIGLILRLTGYDVRCVYDGESALDAAATFKPDVFVLDIGLPRMDGYQLAHALRSDPAFAHSPIVAVTGYGQDEDRRRAREAGFDHHMTKPVDLAGLLQFVANPASVVPPWGRKPRS